jgi:hypothetical protein
MMQPTPWHIPMFSVGIIQEILFRVHAVKTSGGIEKDCEVIAHS